MDREGTEVLLVRLWDHGPSWKVELGAVESLLRPHVLSHSAVCWEGTVAMPGHTGELCPFASLPQLLGCDLGSAALTLLHPCHGTCDWRGMMPRSEGQCKSASTLINAMQNISFSASHDFEVTYLHFVIK